MPPKRFSQCIIHIGTEKTGSKAIQDYLNRNRTALTRAKILYPKPLGDAQLSQWQFVAAVHPHPWRQDIGRSLNIFDEDSRAAFKSNLIHDLEKQFHQYPQTETLILSSEHFQSRLPDAQSILDLKRLLSRWVNRFWIVVYFRRQDQFAVSLLSTRIKSFVPMKKTELQQELGAPRRYFDYLALFDLWGSVFGRDAILARLYQQDHWPNNDLIQDFCATAGIPHNGEETQRMNVSLSRKGFQFLMAVNNLFPITPGDHTNDMRRRLVDAVSENFPGKYYPITQDQAQTFYEQFDESNEQLRQRAFENLPYPLFDDDFSEYPTSPDSEFPEYSEAVEIAVSLWRQKLDHVNSKRNPIQRIKSIFPWLNK